MPRKISWFAIIMALFACKLAYADPIRCDDLSTADLAIDGLLDDWRGNQVLARVGSPATAAIELRCSWDGNALALALDLKDDRVVRVRGGHGHEDRIGVRIAAPGGRAIAIVVYPGTPIAKAKIAAPARVAVADSLQPKGFSIEARVPASAIPALGAATPSLELHVTFHDSDLAMGGDDADIPLDLTVELGDRKDLMGDFLRAVKLRETDVKLDVLADLDPDRRGNERLVWGGTVIGVLTDQFAYVTLPVTRAADVREVKLLPLGPRGSQVIAAMVRQGGNGGSRDLLMLWTVWSGQLQPLGQIEVRKQLGGGVLESEWKVVRGKKGAELWVTPKAAVGLTAGTWNEEPAQDADPIVLPWDRKLGGMAYWVSGKELERRELPVGKRGH